jgi:hypothetical protein
MRLVFACAGALLCALVYMHAAAKQEVQTIIVGNTTFKVVVSIPEEVHKNYMDAAQYLLFIREQWGEKKIGEITQALMRGPMPKTRFYALLSTNEADFEKAFQSWRARYNAVKTIEELAAPRR